jgi:hypothetical protein
MIGNSTSWSKRARIVPILLALATASLFASVFLQRADTFSTQKEEKKQTVYDPGRVCSQSMYAAGIASSLEDVAKQMDTWLGNLDQHLTAASGKDMTLHDHARFFPFNVMAPCQNKSCVGGPCRTDTSKIVCGLERLKQETKMTSTKCIVYSIGGNNLWEFETDILQNTSCDVHTFDCTGSKSRFQKPSSDRLHFHHVCLGTTHERALPEKECRGSNSKCGETWTLLEMQQKLKHTRIDLLKVDIEGFEWPLFESWPELTDPGADKLVLPMQIAVEIHYQTQFSVLRAPSVTQDMDFRLARDVVQLQAHLLRMGYVVVERDDNMACPHCTELTLIRYQCPNTGAYAVGARGVSRRL